MTPSEARQAATRGARARRASAPPTPERPGERVNFHLLVEDEPGVIRAVSAVFAGRGVSMDAVLAHRTLSQSGEPVAEITLSTRATPRRRKMLQRALERLRFVHRVLAFEEDSERIGEAALVEIRAGSGVPYFDNVKCFPVDAPEGAPRRLLLY